MELVKELPEIFEEFAEQRQRSFLVMKEVKDKGIPVVGAYCTYFPQEIAMAMGAVTVGLCSTSDETIPIAEKDLPKNLCPMVKASYGFAVSDKCPFFYFSDVVVGETTCDGKKKMYELMKEFKNVYIMELPNSQREDSLELWTKEIIRFKEYLEKTFNVEITEEKVRHALREKLMKEYEEKEKPERKKRILLTGCPSSGAPMKVVKAIEEHGGNVVVYENCGGAKSVDRLIDEDAEDIYKAIAERYLAIGCSVMTPDNNRIELMGRLLEEYNIEGVVEMTLQACHTYNIEAKSIEKFVKSKGLPYIHVETDYSQADIGQLDTRIAAFLEMI